MSVEVCSLSEDNVDDALSVCTQDKLRDDPSYRKGLKLRREWLLQLYKTVGPCCKIAYIENVPVGMIQFTPLQHVPYFQTKKKDVLYIHCIYVKKEFREKGIASKLLHALINEMRKPNSLFEAQPCKILVTTARERYAFKQPSYFLLKGFKKTDDNVDVGLLYWLFETNRKEKLDIPVSDPVRVSEEGVRIFSSPFCQFYAGLRTESIRKFVREVKPNTKVEEVNLWTQPEEAIQRGVTCPAIYVNGKPILFMDPEKFWETIKAYLIQA